MWEWLRHVHTLLSHRACLSPKRPRQDRRDSGVSAALWEWLRPVHTSFSYLASLSPKRPRQDWGDLGASSAVWEWLAHEYLVLPQGVPIPQAIQAGLEGLGCIRRRVGVAGPCISRSPKGRTIPKRPKQVQGDSGVAAAMWEWLGHAYLVLPQGVRIPQAV